MSSDPTGAESWVERAAAALEHDATVMASALAAYRRRTSMSTAELAAWLELTPVSLAALSLCRRPDPVGPTFATDVAALAAYIGCVPDRLEILLQAARDRT